jgi:23S rRNA (cytosine1962-C5)-methyltransferase
MYLSGRFCFASWRAILLASVTGIDASRAALEVAEENLAVNRHRIQARSGLGRGQRISIFCVIGALQANTYDTVVLDPPAFAKSKRAVDGALRGYKELNLRAMKMLRPGWDSGHLFLLPPRFVGRISWGRGICCR